MNDGRGLILEIRIYRLLPGTRATFDREARARSLPMLARHGIRVVRCEPSLVDDDHYVLIRAYRSIAEREAQEDAFYNSAEWREVHGPVLNPLIESYQTVLLEADEAAVQGLTGAPANG